MSLKKSSADKQREFNELKEKVKRSVTCTEIMARAGCFPDRTEAGNLDWYKSPFREEKTASFKVDNNTNSYIDFGESMQYHDVIELIMRFNDIGAVSFDSKFSHLQKFSQAVLYLADMAGLIHNNGQAKSKHIELNKPKNIKQEKKQEPKIIINSVSELKTRSLIDYFVNDRKINKDVVENMLVEVRYSYPNKPEREYYSAGFQNRSKGYELRSPPTNHNPKGYKGGTHPKDITLIRGSSPTRSIDVWEGFTDMMTMLTLKGVTQPQNNTIVLNSTSLVSKALEYLIGYQERRGDLKKVYAYVDNDTAGHETIHTLRYGTKTEKELKELTEKGRKPIGLNELGVEVIAQNERVYPKHNDLNQFHTEILENKNIISETKKTPQPSNSI